MGRGIIPTTQDAAIQDTKNDIPPTKGFQQVY